MRKYIFAALGLLSLGLAPMAEAAPALSFRVYDDNGLVGALSTTSTNGALLASGSSTNFNVSASAFGSPIVDMPSLLAQTTTISTGSTFTGTHTIRVEFTQTGLTSASAGGLMALLGSTFTANFLVNTQNVSSVTLTNYVDANNGAFVRTTQIGSQTYTGGPTNSSPLIQTGTSLANPLFSETVVITATFTGSGAGLQSTAQIIRVPEPASLALFGSALLGLGLVRRARRKS